MAVISVTERWEQESSEGVRDLVTGAAEGVLTREYAVLFDTGTHTADDALWASDGATTIPDWGTSHPNDPWLRVTRKRATPRSPWLYDVIVTYVRKYAADPSAEPPVVTLTSRRSMEDIDRTISGKPIVNVNGNLFDPPIQREFTDMVLTITRNEANLFPSILAVYRDVLNKESFYGFLPGMVLCRMPEAASVNNGGAQYWSVRYTFEIRTELTDGNAWGWHKRVLECGYKVRKPGSDPPEYVLALDDEKRPVNEPVLLDVDGYEIPKDPSGEYVGALWTNFVVYPTVSFGALNL